jgi:hypothetical protein
MADRVGGSRSRWLCTAAARQTTLGGAHTDIDACADIHPRKGDPNDYTDVDGPPDDAPHPY